MLWECCRCGVIFTEPQSIDRGTVRVYEHYHDGASFITPPTVEASLERLVKSSERFRRTGRWLDFGFGEGGLLAVAERYGWQSYGIEVSRRALEHGQERGWSVTCEPREDPRFVVGAFDVVSMVELLEHIPTPLRVLEDAARWLRPGGLLYITTPNVRSVNRRMLGTAWSIVCPPTHVILWTAPALRGALAVAGFQILRLRAEGWNPSEVLARLPWRTAGQGTVNRQQSGIALSEALARTKVRRAAKAAVNQCLSVLRLGDTLKAWALRESY